MMTIAHCVESLALHTGGPARTVTALTDGLSVIDDCSIVLLSQRHPQDVIVTAAPGSLVDRRITESNNYIALKTAWPVRRNLQQLINVTPPSLLHYHGMWNPSQYYFAAAAKRHHIPLMLHTRGMMEPWALNYRRMKKKIALALYARKALSSVSVFFATAEQEAEGIRNLGFTQPIAVIPNGVTLQAPALPAEVSDGHCPTGRTALFLSRVHPKKGILNLLKAWHSVRPVNWRLVLAGPDDGGHLIEVQRLIADLSLQDSVEYVGEINGVAKASLYENADLFILPSYSENFGVVVLEALSSGLPVITTHGTPWRTLPEKDCGWWVAADVASLTECIREALMVSPEELQNMGEKGRLYAKKFCWSGIASQTAEVYRWALGKGALPGCVVL